MTTPRQRLALGFLLVPSFLLLGFVAGALVAALRETSSMGVDQLANALGSGMLGAVIGVIVAVVLLPRLRARTLVVAAVLALLLAVLLIVSGRAGAESRRAARQAARWERPGQPALRASALRSRDLAASLS